MAELPDDGDRGELWRVRVPVVFDIAARSRRRARGIVDEALTSRSIGALSVPEGREGIRGWSHQEDSYPGLNTSASAQQTFLADLNTIEVLRTLVETEAQEPGTLRVLTAAELQQLRITLAAADRYVEIPNPEYPESDPLFAGHATEAAPELPDGLYEGKDIGGRAVRLAVGPSRLNALGRTAATLPLGNLTIRVLHTPGHTPACVTYLIGDAAFVGDTLLMPDYGSARCDFPGGDAAMLHASIQKILALPP